MHARTVHCVRVAPQYDQRCRLTDSAAPEMPARSSGYVCVLSWSAPLLMIALPATPIVPQNFFHCVPHAALVLFQHARVLAKKGGLPIPCFYCRDDEMQVNCREATHPDIWTPHCLHVDVQGSCVLPVVTAPRLPAAAFSGTIAMQDSTRPGFWSVPHCGSPEVERAEAKN
jgi:hypothetical protein